MFSSMDELLIFTCGHSQEQAPPFMGRGKARLKRIAEYFNRSCLVCAEKHLLSHLASLTDSKGNARPADPSRVAERLTALRKTYL